VLAAVSRMAQRPLRILDVGCGRGWLTQELSRFGSVVGVDFSVQEARRCYPNLSFKEANIVLQFPKGTYDVVVSSEVIEHLPQEHQAGHIRNSADALCEGGLFILTTPNKQQVEQLTKKHSDTSYLQPIENWLSVKKVGNARSQL